MKNISQKIFCAFCRLERNVNTKKNVDWTNVALSLFAALVAMMGIWGGFDPRVVIVFVIFIAIAEVFVRLRWRMSLPCVHCNFDPLLYKVDRAESVRRVQKRLDYLRHSGQHLLKQNNPFQNIPIVRVDSETKKKTVQPPRYLSKEI
jgi:hypothetical protein